MSDSMYILEISMANDLDFYVRRTICGVYSAIEKAMEAGRLLVEEWRDDIEVEDPYCDDIVAAYIYRKKPDITDPYTMPIYKWSSVYKLWEECSNNE